MSDGLAARMKAYEQAETGRRLLSGVPVLARLDGKRFSRFTAGLERPYDARLGKLMVETTRHLVEASSAVAGYTQSDEITLLFYADDVNTQTFLDGRVLKLTSILTSMATAYFNTHLAAAIPERAGALALFDCRVWAVPNPSEAACVFLWREADAARNSLSTAVRCYYPHEEVEKKGGAELHELLFGKGVNWNDYPVAFKRGTYILRRTIVRAFSVEERAQLPPRHDAHANPDLRVTRTELRAVELPPMSRVTNRVAVLFEQAEPRTLAVDG